MWCVKRLPVIALLDDEPQLRKALRRLLVAHGFAVVTFERGGDVLSVLEAQPMNCLLLDLHLPEVTGFDVLEGISSRGITTPVIVLTGHGEPDTAERVMAMGAAAYLTKPVDEAVLLSAIAEATGNGTAPRNPNSRTSPRYPFADAPPSHHPRQPPDTTMSATLLDASDGIVTITANSGVERLDVLLDLNNVLNLFRFHLKLFSQLFNSRFTVELLGHTALRTK